MLCKINLGSAPISKISSASLNASCCEPLTIKDSSSITLDWSANPSMSLTFCSVMSWSWRLKVIIAWSKTDKASRTDPSEDLAMIASALSSTLACSLVAMPLKKSCISSILILRKSNLWHLDKIVTGIFFTSVVAKINLRWAGGSSKVFNRALKACFDNMWTSSMINTLYFALAGKYCADSKISLISSIPVLEAASISKISIWLESTIASQWQYSSFEHFSSLPNFLLQLIALAIILAVVVLPTPRIPVSR